MKTNSIAIVGMAGRFPGARSTAEFWQNLRDGVESIRDISESDLLAAGALPEDLANPGYVRRAAILHGVPVITTLTGAAAAASAIAALKTEGLSVKSLQEYHGTVPAASATRAV